METQKLNILVTGGLGTLGRPLVEELRKRGHNVWVSAPYHANYPNFIRCDVSYFRQVEQMLESHKLDYVYHLANEFGRKSGEEFYESLWKTNAVGMRNMLKMQERLGFGMIYPGSAEMYEAASIELVSNGLPEKSTIRLDNDYTISKWVNEMQIRNSIEKYGTKTVRLRLSSIYGPGEYYSDFRSAICIFIYRALHNMPYVVYTDAKRAFLYIEDAVRAAANACKRFIPGAIYTVTGKEVYDMKQISDMILKMLGKDDRLVEYKTGDPSVTLFKEQDALKAMQDLDHAQTISLEEGLQKTVEWQKKIYGK